MANPNPRYLKPQVGLTATQRKSLGLGDPVKYVRNTEATPPRTFVNASMPKGYRSGDGEQRVYTCSHF